MDAEGVPLERVTVKQLPARVTRMRSSGMERLLEGAQTPGNPYAR